MENQENSKKGTFSRRGFFKGAALAGVAAAAMGLSGCNSGSNSESGGGNGGGASVNTEGLNVSVFETDVLIIGGGLAGVTAARSALKGSAHVTVVDKGPWGSCGTSGINWGHDCATNEWFTGDIAANMKGVVTANDGLMNQSYGLAVREGLRAAHSSAYAEQVGIVLQRWEGGRPSAENADVPGTAEHGWFLRWHARDIKIKGANIHDRTFILDVLKDANGEAAGAVGINLVTGDPVVFHAKAVIMATGSYVWAAGYNGQTPYTIASPENTGDGFKMLLDAGVSFADMEHMVTDISPWYPKGCRQGMGGVLGSTPTHAHILDKDYARVTEPLDSGGGYPEFFRLLVIAHLAGRSFDIEGTDQKALYVDIDGIGLPDWNRYYARIPENFKRGLDYDYPQYVKDVFSQWDCCGKPSELSKYGETTIPGVYFASASEGLCFSYSCGGGWISGEGAAERAKNMTSKPEIPWNQVSTLLGDAYGLLDADPSTKVRSLEVYRNAQKAYWTGLQPIRSADSLNACLAELDRVEAEDLPHMYIPSKSRRYNTDWVRALEARNILTVARAAALSALAREESRGYHCRTDFPKIDNDNWLKNIHVSCANGDWKTEARDVDDSVVPVADFKPLLATFGLE